MTPWLPVSAAAVCALLLLNAAAFQRPATDDELARYRNLGKAFYENPTTQNEAVDAFRKALQLAPNSTREQLNYGLALLRAGKTAEGVAELQTVQKRDPKLPHTWFNLGIVYKKNGEHEKAIVQFERMIQLVPDEPISHYNLGALYKLAGRQQDAVREFETAAKLDATLAAPHFQLYNAYRTGANPEGARRELEIFQRLKKQQEGAAIPEDVEWNMFAEVYDIMEDAAPPPPSSALKFEVRTGRALPPAPGPCTGRQGLCVALDYDHDYDLDVLLLGDTSQLLRSEGPDVFNDRSASFPFEKGRVTGATAFRLVADTKGYDLVVAYADKSAVLYRDKLQGVFRTEQVSIPAGAPSLTAGRPRQRRVDRSGVHKWHIDLGCVESERCFADAGHYWSRRGSVRGGGPRASRRTRRCVGRFCDTKRGTSQVHGSRKARGNG